MGIFCRKEHCCKCCRAYSKINVVTLFSGLWLSTGERDPHRVLVRRQDGRRADEAGAVPRQAAARGRGREAPHSRHFPAAHSPPARLTDDKFHPLFRRRHRALFQLNLHLTKKRP